MSAVTVVEWQRHREEGVKREDRKKIHEALEAWLDGLEESLMNAGERPTLEALTGAIRGSRQELMAKVAKAWIERRYREELEQRVAGCPKCGGRVFRSGLKPRRLDTLIGTVTVERPYFYCERCQLGFSPLDDILALSGGEKQYDLHKAAVKLAMEMPYREASALLGDLLGAPMSDHVIHDVVGEVAKSPSAEEIRARVSKVRGGKKRRPVMVLAIDGAHVATRPEEARGTREGGQGPRSRRPRWKGQWREAKGFRLYLVKGDRIVHLLSWHQIQTEEELAAALEEVKAAGLIPEEEVRFCVVADGASWIWKSVQELFPSARQVLDYYHCCERLHQVEIGRAHV